jgi:hypothetical protein
MTVMFHQKAPAVPVLCLALALGGVPALAQADTISGAVDGVARDWHVLPVDGVSSARFAGNGMFTMATIFGFPQPSDAGNVTGALELSITLQGQPGAMAAVDSSVVYYAGGVRQLYLPDPDDPAVTLSLNESRADDDALFLSGRIEARVHRVVSITTEELDLSDSHQIEADFAVTLSPN